MEMNDYAGNAARSDDKLIVLTRYLEESAERLKELDRQKDAFLDIAAHELKTPITSIQGFAQILQDESILSDVERSRHYLSLIDHNSNRLYYLILNMIDAFKIVNNSLKHNIEHVDLYEIFNSTREKFEEQILSKGIHPEFIIDKGIPAITSDSEKISRTLRNLLSNSISYTESGDISLRIYCDEQVPGCVQFEVKDTGRGIPKEHQEMLFSAFHQIDASLNRRSGGIGLGLFISKGLIENIGGKMWFESSAGKGSKFIFSIPISYDQEAAGAARSYVEGAIDDASSETDKDDRWMADRYGMYGGNGDGQ
jgi:signal transduction histidine kinase